MNENNNNNNESNSATGIDEYLEDCRYEKPIVKIIEDEVEEKDNPMAVQSVIVDKDTYEQIKKELKLIGINQNFDDSIRYGSIQIMYNENYVNKVISVRDEFEELKRINLI